MTSRRYLIVPMALLGAMVLAPQPAHAACNPLSACSCTVTATGVSFGSYDPLSQVDNGSTGAIRVVCTLILALGGSFTIDLSTGASGSYTQRSLKKGASTLAYNLFSDSAYSQIWGNGTGGSTQVSQTFTSLLIVDRTLTVYGRIPAGQNVAAGAYADTIIVTVTY
jgi:spore coat protein U-like protein